MTFQVGDRIVFKHPEFESLTGEVYNMDSPYPGALHVLMLADTVHPSFGSGFRVSAEGKPIYRFDSIHCFPLYEMGPPVPEHIKQKQIVTDKCQKLWSKSKWGKKHPAFSC